MKIISLNTWGARRENELQNFIQHHLPTTDIFCFQEVYGDAMTAILENLFSAANYHRVESHKYIYEQEKFDIVTFVSNKYQISSAQELFTTDDYAAGQALAVNISVDDTNTLQLINAHGLSRPGTKQDTPERLYQSKQIIDFINEQDMPVIVMGDFNLDIATRSVALFSESGLRNLIVDYKIHATRNKITWERYPDTPQMYADYTFVGKDITVRDFQVIDNEVSDHLPMILLIA